MNQKMVMKSLPWLVVAIDSICWFPAHRSFTSVGRCESIRYRDSGNYQSSKINEFQQLNFISTG